MLTDEQMAMLHRRLTLVGAVAKHGFYGDSRVVDVIGPDETPIIKSSVDGNDTDIANLFAELRIYRQMFDAKLEGFRNAGAKRVVGSAEMPELAESVERVKGDAEEGAADSGGSGPAGESPERPDPAADSGRKKRRAKKLDSRNAGGEADW